MPTVVLAIGDAVLRATCAAELGHASHTVIAVDRPLALLTLHRRVAWDFLVVDGSSLGADVLRTLPSEPHREVVGLDVAGPAIGRSLGLPLAPGALTAVLAATAGRRPNLPRLSLDAERRLAALAGRQVALTRTEFRLLRVLLERAPEEVPLNEVLERVWGIREGLATSELVRAHVRNLRGKLIQIGLPDAVVSRRGRGYALSLPGDE